MFINESADLYDLKEAMWEVEFKGNNIGSNPEFERFGSTIGIQNNTVASTPGYMQAVYLATATQFNLYSVNDLRRDWNIAPYYYNGNDGTKATLAYTNSYIWGRPVAKWRRDYETVLPKAQAFGPTNWPLLRYSDVLLMFAEAENQVNGPTAAAYAAINKVRERAYGSGSRVATVTITNPGAGYTTAPQLIFSPFNPTTYNLSPFLPATNNPATGYTVVTGGKVTSIIVTCPGAFYTTVPTVTIGAPPAGGVQATATVTISPINSQDADLAPGLSTSAFFNAVKDERARELCFEGLRKTDLVRWGILLPTLKQILATTASAPVAADATRGYPGLSVLIVPYTNATERDNVFPIPAPEITSNPLAKQNPGW